LLDRAIDQAHGLRRMFAPGRPCVIQLVAGTAGVGRTTVAVNLAVALARSGRDTLLVDAVPHATGARAFAYLGLDTPAASPSAKRALLVPGMDGLALWPLVLEQPGASSQPAIPIPDQLPGRNRSPDCVLVNSACGRSLVWSGEHESHEVVIVLSRAAASITDAYALIKRMSTYGMQTRFHVLVNRVGSEAEARLIFSNMAAVAQGYLDVRLQWSGFIPADEALARAAAQGRSVQDIEPDAPATHAFRRLAQRMASRGGRRPGGICAPERPLLATL
jgi:flagellar biosynthesis protein FlhG